jgi:hypothetical protein
MYITEHGREERLLWADLDKAERLVLLRRWAVERAVQKGRQKEPFSYRDVQELFEEKAMAGPSHQYAYDLMEAAADEAGFKYGSYKVGSDSKQVQLRVDVSSVRPEIINWIREETSLDPERVSVVADITSYTAGPTPAQDEAADD